MVWRGKVDEAGFLVLLCCAASVWIMKHGEILLALGTKTLVEEHGVAFLVEFS